MVDVTFDVQALGTLKHRTFHKKSSFRPDQKKKISNCNSICSIIKKDRKVWIWIFCLTIFNQSPYVGARIFSE